MINLWAPQATSLGLVLLTAFLLGIVHGVTPDEHTWPITFSYAVGGYSTRRGLRAGLLFSLAFTIQRALASELAYLGLARLFVGDPSLGYVVYIVVGCVMAWAGWSIQHGKAIPFYHPQTREPWSDPRPWMPAVHGFIAGWGFGAFAIIIYTVLAPSMPSAAWGWVPGALFGLGTTVVQAAAGAGIGYWLSRRKKISDPAVIRRIGLRAASRTLELGGVAFVGGGLFGLLFPTVASRAIDTGIRIHNLHTIGLPFVLVVGVVLVIGITSVRRAIRETLAAPPPSAPLPRG
jgi:threonine/homoserine/homoserine lactone efflux protein